MFYIAYCFHHSMIVLTMLTPLILLPLDKKGVLAIVIVFLPVLAYIMQSNLNIVDALNIDYLSDKMEIYVDREGEQRSFFGQLANVLLYGTFYVPIVIDIHVYLKYKKSVERTMVLLFRLLMIITLFSFSFLFMGFKSAVFFYRFLYMTMIPIVIITVYFYSNGLMSKRQYKAILLWGITAVSFDLFHMYYIL